MSGKINMLCSGMDVPLADDRKKFSRMMFVEQIEEHPDFKALYRIDAEVLNRITQSMKENGYDNSQPVHVWNTDNGHSYLIDGYTRFTACRASGLTSIPVYEHEFRDFDEAYKYVLSLQVNRRNLNGDELLRNVALLSKCSFVKNAKGYKTDAIAESLGVSSRTVERALSVSKNADKETLGQIERQEITVNQAYKKIHGKKKRATISETVSRIAYYVIAEMSSGFDAASLLDDEDFKDAICNPEKFEIPENDIRFLMDKGVSEEILRGKND